MGLSEEDFWNSTPKEIFKLKDFYNLEQRREDLRAGLITAAIYNTGQFGSKKKWYKPEDFFAEGIRQPKKQQTWQDQLALVKALNAIYKNVTPDQGTDNHK